MGMADDAEPGAGDGADGSVVVCVEIAAAEVENAGVVVVVMLAVVLLVSTSLS